MRASLYLIGFAAASIVGAGVVEIGCSSSSSPPANTPAEDAAADAPAAPVGDTGTPTGDGGTPTPCTPLSDASVATLVAPEVPGEASWTCLEGKCGPSLTACAADCTCNNDILTALNCLAPPDGGNVTTCFGPVISSTNPPDIAALACLSTNMTACTATGDGGTDGGTPEGGSPEASTTDAGDGG